MMTINNHLDLFFTTEPTDLIILYFREYMDNCRFYNKSHEKTKANNVLVRISILSNFPILTVHVCCCFKG